MGSLVGSGWELASASRGRLTAHLLKYDANPFVATGAAIPGAGVAVHVPQGTQVQRGNGVNHRCLRDLQAMADVFRGAISAG